MTSLSRGTVRRRWVIGVWLLLAVASAPLAFRVQRELEVTVRIPGSEAGEVERLLTTRFASPFAHHALLVASGVPSPDSTAGLEVLGALIVAVDTVPGVTRTLSYLDVADTLFLGAQRRGTYVLVGIDAATRPDVIVPLLRETTARVADSLRATHPALEVRWTGEVPINYDLRRTSGDDARRAELRVLPLTLALLLAAFGALVAASLPLASGALAIVIALGLAALLNRTWPLSILLQNTVSMIGLGVGIDYALLTVSRFREAVARGASADEAAAQAGKHSGRAIALSGATVMVGFAALLLVPVNEIQSTGVAGIIVVTVSVLIAITLLPEVLATLGHRIERGRFFLKARADMNPREQRWRAWGRSVVNHPWRVLLLAGAPLVLLSWQALRMKSQLPSGNWLPARMESARGAADLVTMQRDGIVNSLRVIVELPAGTTVFDSTGWIATRRLTTAVGALGKVGRAQSIASLLASEMPNRALFLRLPEGVQRSLVSSDTRSAVIEIVVSGDADFNDAIALTRAIRSLDASSIGGTAGTRLRVGGLAAVQADYVDVIHAHANKAILLVLGLTLVVLMLGFRSVLIPIKAVLLNLLSVASAFGAVVLVFQDGIGARLIGLDAPLPGVFPAIPILVFCIVFGLSMDYEVFLVARVAEARQELSDADAIVEGLAKTGGVITSAAAIMVAVFGAFALGDFLFIKMLGFALVVAVFVDATLVRMAIGPALLRLGGRWNWWPRS